MEFDAYIFDLDGTLLDTLPDLVRLTNMVLEERGWPQRTQSEILSFVGDGGHVLLRRAAPEGASDEEIDEAFLRWKELYPTYGHALTTPYEGIPEALAALKEGGAKLAVLSNKFDDAVRQVVAEQFPGVFDVARGECAEIPRKPDPAGLGLVLDALGVSAQQAAFVGDSANDMKVAQRAGALPLGVTWGYNPADALWEAGAQRVVDHPSALVR